MTKLRLCSRKRFLRKAGVNQKRNVTSISYIKDGVTYQEVDSYHLKGRETTRHLKPIRFL